MGKLAAVVYRGVRFFGPSQARKPTVCWFCDMPIATGAAVFRPLGNGMERMRRLHEQCAETVAEGASPDKVLRHGEKT